MSIRLNLMGPLQLTIDGEIQANFRSQRVQALLIYLVSENRPVPRPELVELFWPDVEEAKGRANLRWSLNQLGKVLPDSVAANRQTVQFNPPADLTIDLAQIENADDSILAQMLPDSIGEFCAGFYLDQSPAFEAWLLAERERWQQKLLAIGQRLTFQMILRGSWSPAIKLAGKLINLDAWNEDLHRLLMVAYASAGEYDAATEAYEQCRGLLWNELSVETEPATKKLYDRIETTRLQHQQPALWQPTRFVGRADEIDNIATLLQEPEVRLVTVLGIGGTGKTRLVQALVRRLQFFYADGAVFVSLVAAKTSADMLGTIARAFNYTFRGPLSPQQQLINLFKHKELLLVLDNMEQLVDEALALNEFLQNAPGLEIVVTSRVALNLRIEHLFDLDGLAIPPADESAPEQFASVQLFLDTSRRLRREFEPDAGEFGSIKQMCQLLQGNPLAIELAASTIRTKSCADMLAALQASFASLQTPMQDVPARHGSVRAVFAYSWSLLPVSLQTILPRLALFRESFSVEAAQLVAAATDEMLSELARHSLISVVGTGRYAVHELLRQFAEEKLVDASREEATLQFCHYFLEQLPAWREQFLRVDETIVQHLELEFANIRQAWQLATQTNQQPLLELAVDAFTEIWLTKGQYLDLDDCLVATGKLTSISEALPHQITVGRAKVAVQRSQFDDALAYLEPLLANSESLSNEVKFVAHLHAGTAKMRLGDQEQATELTQIALQAADTAEKKGLCHNQFGTIDFYLGRNELARNHYQKAYEIFSELGHLRHRASALGNIALTMNNKGSEQSIPILEEVLTLFQQLNDPFFIGVSYLNLSVHYREANEFGKSREVAINSLPYHQQVGNRMGEAMAHNQLATSTRQLGEFAQSTIHARKAQAIYIEIGHKNGLVHVYLNLALTMQLEKKYPESMQYADQAIEVATEINGVGHLAFAHAIKGEVRMELGDFAAAEDSLLKSLRLYKEVDGSDQRYTEAFLLSLYVRWDKLSKAQRYYEACEAHLRTVTIPKLSYIELYQPMLDYLEQTRPAAVPALEQEAVNMVRGVIEKIADSHARETTWRAYSRFPIIRKLLSEESVEAD